MFISTLFNATAATSKKFLSLNAWLSALSGSVII